MTRIFVMMVLMMGVVMLAACGGNGNSTADGGEGGTPDKLIFTAIPDDDAGKAKAKFAELGKYLEAKVGIPVEYEHVTDYKGAVTALEAKRAHISYLGGVTTVQASRKAGIEVLCCRDIDREFVTYFIANKDAGIGECKNLKELAEKAKGKDFSFGSTSSTSGHIMPRHFFLKMVGDTPENVFGDVSYSKGHDKTLANVNSGTVQVGAMNFKTFDTAKAEEKANTEIVWRTPGYLDYSISVRKDLDPELIKKLRAAFLEISADDEQGKKILEAFGAGKFIKAELSEWDDIADVMKAVNLGG